MKTAVRLIGSIALLGVLVWRVDVGQIASAFTDLYWPAWLLALGIYFLAQAASALRWGLLAHAVGLKEAPAAFLSDYFVGMFFNLFLPTSVGGDVVRAWRLARRPGATPPGGRTLAAVLSVLAERLSGLAVLIALACIAVTVCPLPLPLPTLIAVGVLGSGVFATFASLPLLRHFILPWLRRVFSKWSVSLDKVQQLTDGAVLLLKDPYVLWTSTALSLVVQVANIALIGLIGAGLGLPVPPLYYAVLVPLVTLLTLLPISLNGVGLREAGFIILLAPTGVSAASAISLSLLTFAVYLTASLTGVFFLWLDTTSPSLSKVEVRADDESFGGNSDPGRTRQPPSAA